MIIGNARIRSLLSLLLFAAIVGLGVYYYAGHKEDFHLIAEVSVKSLVILSVLQMGASIFYGLQLKILTDHFNLSLRFSQWYWLVRATTFANLWLPSGGGASVKALYLKRFHNLPYSSFAALTGIANLIKFMVFSLLALVLLGLFEKAPALLYVIFASIFLGTLLVLLLGHRISARHLSSLEFVRIATEQWQEIRGDRKTVILLIGVNCMIFAVVAAEIYFAFRVFSVDLSLIMSGLMAAITTITSAVKLIPGNLGVREAIIATVAEIEGVGMNAGLHAAVLLRVISVAWSFVLLPLFIRALLPKQVRNDNPMWRVKF